MSLIASRWRAEPSCRAREGCPWSSSAGRVSEKPAHTAACHGPVLGLRIGLGLRCDQSWTLPLGDSAKNMKTDELREKYLAFFESKGHTRCPSDVLVPTWDPSVLFTPAGMNQFKDHFLGKVKLDFTRATTCQKCLAHRRHRQRRTHRLPPHVLRNAGQLQLRGLFQAGRDRSGPGSS